MEKKLQTVARATGPTLGMALGYFAVIWGVKNGYIDAVDKGEAVAMAGVAGVHFIVEVKGFFRWVVSLFSKKEK